MSTEHTKSQPLEGNIFMVFVLKIPLTDRVGLCYASSHGCSRTETCEAISKVSHTMEDVKFSIGDMMSKKKTFEEYIEDFREVHGDRYQYQSGQQLTKGNKTKVKITCLIHGEFLQEVYSHKRGIGCPDCGFIRTSNLRKSNTEEFIKKSMSVYGDTYDYSKAKYTKNKEKLTVTCPKHGDFMVTPNNHLRGHGCPVCAGTLKGNTDKFIRKSKDIHGTRYDYSKSDYTLSREKLIITCSEHGDFWMTPQNHFNGHGCPGCWHERAGWQLTEEQLKQPYITYFLKFLNENTNTSFYKIGITGNGLKQRFSSASGQGFSYQTIRLYRDTGKECQKFERDLIKVLKSKDEYKNTKDLENSSIGGWTECFSCDNLAKEIEEIFIWRCLMKTYEYQDDSWWDSVCDCHEPTLMPVYNLINDVDQYTYSCHTEEDCYRQCLEIEGIIDEEMDFDYNEIDFELMCQMYGIRVIIHYQDEED